ncbi:MAG: DUF481 domain-containing protein [Phycisphaeraceae bacterium]|nr:DUF481 domain-containing protein [Phycisphaeraceae bacterium]
MNCACVRCYRYAALLIVGSLATVGLAMPWDLSPAPRTGAPSLQVPITAPTIFANATAATLSVEPTDSPPPESDSSAEPDQDARSLDQGEGFRWPRFLTGWKRRVEFGANGAEGNVSSNSVRTSLLTTRNTPETETTVRMQYLFATREGNTTQNRFDASMRYDNLLPKSDWRTFLTATYESDQFRDWDHRVGAGGGFGYQAYKDESTSLLARGGVNLSRDFGGLDEDVRTQAILGVDVTHTISPRQKLTATLDVFPDLTSAGDVRANARATWEFLIDPESRLSLRLGGEDRFDTSASSKSKRNDLTYFAVLAFEF